MHAFIHSLIYLPIIHPPIYPLILHPSIHLSSIQWSGLCTGLCSRSGGISVNKATIPVCKVLSFSHRVSLQCRLLEDPTGEEKQEKISGIRMAILNGAAAKVTFLRSLGRDKADSPGVTLGNRGEQRQQQVPKPRNGILPDMLALEEWLQPNEHGREWGCMGLVLSDHARAISTSSGMQLGQMQDRLLDQHPPSFSETYVRTGMLCGETPMNTNS